MDDELSTWKKSVERSLSGADYKAVATRTGRPLGDISNGDGSSKMNPTTLPLKFENQLKRFLVNGRESI